MKSFSWILFCLPILVGCAHNVTYDRADVTPDQLNRDLGQCRLVGLGAPQTTPTYLPTGTMVVANAGGDTQTVDSNPVVPNAMIAIGTAIANSHRQDEAVDACMQAKGYTPYPK